MKAVKLIIESDLSYFIKPLTIEDVEVAMNSAMMLRKIIDIQNNNRSKIYYIGLFDMPINDSTCYQVNSNAIGLEAIRNFCAKHKATNLNSESINSTYICFQAKDDEG